MDKETMSRFERDEEERRRKPEYELHIVISLPSERAFVELMKELQPIIHRADPMAVFGGGEKPHG